jgi:hypothetical protein
MTSEIIDASAGLISKRESGLTVQNRSGVLDE